MLTKLNNLITAAKNAEPAEGVKIITSPYNSPQGRGNKVVCTLTSSDGTISCIKYIGPSKNFKDDCWDTTAVLGFFRAKMNDIYKTLQVEYQGNPEFASVYVAVKDFLQRGEFTVARKIVELVQVPKELEVVKKQIVDLISLIE